MTLKIIKDALIICYNNNAIFSLLSNMLKIKDKNKNSEIVFSPKASDFHTIFRKLKEN